MKFKGTWVFLVLVLGLGFYAYFGEYKAEEVRVEKESQEKTLLKSKVDQISRVEIAKKEETIVLERGSEGWKIVEPLQDEADNDEVESFLTSMASEKYTGLAGEGEQVDWAQFGLQSPKARIKVRDQAGAETVLIISEKKNFEGSSLLRVGDDKRALLVNSSWVGRAEKKPFDFRRKNLLRSKAASVEEISLKNSLGSLGLISKDGQWQLKDKATAKLDAEVLREFLRNLNETKAKEFINETELKELKLRDPVAKIQLKLNEKTWTAEFFKSKDKGVFARVSEPSLWMKLEEADLGKFDKLSQHSVRDHKAAFKAEIKDVTEIESVKGAEVLRFKKNQGQWQVESGAKSPDLKASGGVLDDLANRVKDLRSVAYLDGEKSLASQASLEFKNEKAEVLFKMDWGQRLKMTIDGVEKTGFKLRTSLGPEIVFVEEFSINSLSLEKLLEKTTPASNTPKEQPEESNTKKTS